MQKSLQWKNHLTFITNIVSSLMDCLNFATGVLFLNNNSKFLTLCYSFQFFNKYRNLLLMFLNSIESFTEISKYQCILCGCEFKIRLKGPTTSTAEPGSDHTPPDLSTVLLWHLMHSSSCHHPLVWKERDRHFTRVPPPLLCATALFGL